MKKNLYLIIFIAVLYCLSPAITVMAGDYPFVGITTKDNVNLRAGYSENFKSLRKLKKDETVIVLDKYCNWYKIKLTDDITCFVAKDYVDKDGYVLVDNLNLRAGPSTKYDILGKLDRSSRVLIIGKEDNWYKIKAPSRAFGWINEELLDYYTEYEEFQEKAAIKKIEDHLTQEENRVQVLVKKKNDGFFTVQGIIEGLGKVIGNPATHKLKVNGKTKYYLKSEKINLNKYVYYLVSIEGKKEEGSFKYPLIIIEKIESIE